MFHQDLGFSKEVAKQCTNLFYHEINHLIKKQNTQMNLVADL